VFSIELEVVVDHVIFIFTIKIPAV
jgi:hypothetical protein